MTKMTRQHFEEAADWILKAKVNGNSSPFTLGAEAVIIHLGRTFNPRFDIGKFYDATQPRLTKVVKAAGKPTPPPITLRSEDGKRNQKVYL